MKILATISILSYTVLASWPLVGWDAYRRFDLFKLRHGEETHQFSSYDRQNHNDDGFNGTHSCLRFEGTACVIAEYEGPGQISDIWFTYDPDGIAKAGDLTVTLDSKIVLSGSIQDIVNGGKGPPFVWPLVGNTNDTMGGNVIKVPMPFSKSMRVTTSNNPHFYHLVYRRFPSHVQPHPFDPNDAASDVVARQRRFGVEDPKSSCGRRVSKTTSNSGEVVLGDGCGIVSQLSVRIPFVKATSYVEDDGRAYARNTGGSAFALKLDSKNSECRLTRRIDKSIGHQNVMIKVNGKDAGVLDSGAPTATGVWEDQALTIPPELTRGMSSINISVHCRSSDLDCNEFFYSLHCRSESGKWQSTAYVPGKDWVLMDVLNVGWNNMQDEIAHGYRIREQTWQGLRQFQYDDANHTRDPIPDMWLTLAFDGHETVSNVSLGAFFGSGLAKGFTRSMMFSVDALIPNGAWTTYFPMPFAKTATIKLLSGSGKPIDATISAVVQKCHSKQPSNSEWGYFRAQYRRSETTPGQLWPLLSSKGPGVAYGVTHTMRGAIEEPSNTLEFLEGDEQVWLNRTTPGHINDTTATILGTGTEDFYESGWYFQDFNAPGMPVVVPYAMPLTGLVSSGYKVLGCKGSCLSVYRQMVTDSQAFPEEGISFNIEHGPDGNNVAANYETCAFYYA